MTRRDEQFGQKKIFKLLMLFCENHPSAPTPSGKTTAWKKDEQLFIYCVHSSADIAFINH